MGILALALTSMRFPHDASCMTFSPGAPSPARTITRTNLKLTMLTMVLALGSLAVADGATPAAHADTYHSHMACAYSAVSVPHSAGSVLNRLARAADALFGEPGRNAIDWDLIEAHHQDLMRVVLSIQEGKISSATLPRRLPVRHRSGTRW